MSALWFTNSLPTGSGGRRPEFVVAEAGTVEEVVALAEERLAAAIAAGDAAWLSSLSLHGNGNDGQWTVVLSTLQNSDPDTLEPQNFGNTFSQVNSGGAFFPVQPSVPFALIGAQAGTAQETADELAAAIEAAVLADGFLTHWATCLAGRENDGQWGAIALLTIQGS